MLILLIFPDTYSKSILYLPIKGLQYGSQDLSYFYGYVVFIFFNIWMSVSLVAIFYSNAELKEKDVQQNGRSK